MIALSTAEGAAVKAPGYASQLRFRTTDGDGNLQNLTALAIAGNRCFTRQISLERDNDQDFATANVYVRRLVDQWNISPMVASSRLNLNAAAAYSPLLAQDRTCVVEAYLAPVDGTPTWREIFRGRIASITEEQENIRIECVDQWHALADAGRFLMTERQYGSAPGVAVESVMQSIITHAHGVPFTASGTYKKHDRVTPTTPNGYYYAAQNDGVAGAEPAWTTTIGATNTSGAVTFKNMGAVVSLWTPASPSWLISPTYNQRREPAWSALKTLVNQLGWELRGRWDSGTSAERLKFSEPDRTKAVPDFTFYPDTTDSVGAMQPSILEAPSFEQGTADVRNDIEVRYWSSSVLDAAGQKTLQSVRKQNDASILAYGPRYMGVVLGAIDQIDTAAEAERLVDALLADLKDPYATKEVTLPLFWAAELGDLYRFKADAYSTTTDQDLAVVRISHTQPERGAPTTRLLCRGKPAAGFFRWRGLDMEKAAITPAPLTGPEAPTGVTITQVQGGLAVTWDIPTAGTRPKEFEVHKGTSAAFAISAATLACVVDGDRAELADLVPGTTYYVKVVPRDALGNRGGTSSEVNTAAGYTTPQAMQPSAYAVGFAPPNGGFEAWPDVNAMPETWTNFDRTGAGFVLVTRETSTLRSGRYSAKMPAAQSTQLVRSAPFPVNEGWRYEVFVWLKQSAAGTNANDIALEWYDATGAFISEDTKSLGSGSTSWKRHSKSAAAPTNARYARVRMKKDTSGGGATAMDIYVDEVRARVPNVLVAANVGSQSISHNTVTVVNYSKTTDTWGAWDDGTDTFTVPTGQAGRYLLSAAVNWAAGTGNLFMILEVFLNGGAHRRIAIDPAPATEILQTGTVLLDLVDGDAVTVRVTQTTGVARNITSTNTSCQLSIVRVEMDSN